MKRILVASIVLGLMHGCALDPRFVEAATADAATLRIVGDPVLPILYENGANCSAHRRWPEGKVRVTQDGRLDPPSTLLRLSPGKPLAINLQRTLRVDKKRTFLGGETVTVRSCDSMVSFVPLERRHYAVAFETDGENCYIELLEASNEQSLEFQPAVGTELRFREKLSSPSTGGAMCK